VPKVIYGFGREDQLDKDAVRRLVASLSRLTGGRPDGLCPSGERAIQRPVGAAALHGISERHQAAHAGLCGQPAHLGDHPASRWSAEFVDAEFVFPQVRSERSCDRT
jgi:hypothetical protein